jgi:hypothetical protein
VCFAMWNLWTVCIVFEGCGREDGLICDMCCSVSNRVRSWWLDMRLRRRLGEEEVGAEGRMESWKVCNEWCGCRFYAPDYIREKVPRRCAEETCD